MYINELHINSLRVSAVFSVLINTLLIYVVQNQQKIKLGNYRFLLIFFAVYNLSYTIGDLIVPMCIHDYKYAFSVFIAGGIFEKKSEIGNIMLAIRYSFVPAAYGVLTSHFIYRYLAIFNKDLLHFFLPHGLILAIFYCGFLMLIWFTMTMTMMFADDEKREYMAPSYLGQFKNDLKEMNVVISVYNDVNSSSSIRNAWLCTIIGSFISCGSVIIYFIFGSLIVLKLQNGCGNMSKILKTQQTNLMKALITQATVPMAVAFTPCLLAWYLPAFNVPIRQWVFCTSSVAMTFFPVLDPLALFFFLPQFRGRVKEMVCGSRVPWTAGSSKVETGLTDAQKEGNKMFVIHKMSNA